MNDFAILISFGFLLSLIWWLYSTQYRNYRTDLTRQRLFRIRDDLFDHAMNGKISFDSKAYGIARSTINGMIRFTHNLSFINYFVILITHKFFGKNEFVIAYNKRLSKELSELPDEGAQLILEAIMKANVVIVTHIVFTSMMLTMFVTPFIFIFKLMNIWQSTIKKITKPITIYTWAAIDAEANCVDIEARNKALSV